jgi:hypothetical protein
VVAHLGGPEQGNRAEGEAEADLGPAQAVAAQQGEPEQRVQRSAREERAQGAEPGAGERRAAALRALHPAGVSAAQEGWCGKTSVESQREGEQEHHHGPRKVIHERQGHPASELGAHQSGEPAEQRISKRPGEVIGRREAEALVGVRPPRTERARQRCAHRPAMGRDGQSGEEGAGAGLNEREHGRAEGNGGPPARARGGGR